MDKYLPGGIIVCFGCFIRGQVINKNGEWEDVIIIPKEPYDLRKQYRKSKRHFLDAAFYKGWDPLYNSRVAFDTIEEAEKYYKSHQKIRIADFKQLVREYRARYVKARHYSIFYEGGIGFVTV